MTITPERQALIDKVTKLLALAESTNHGAEADSARKMAATLMAKHNITLGEGETKDDFEVYDEPTGRTQFASYETYLLHAVSTFCGVGLLKQTFVGGATAYRFIGRPSDIEAFKYMRDLVYNQRSAAWRAYYPTRWGKHPGAKELNKWKNGFALGVCTKIEALMKMSEEQVQEWGLVVVKPEEQALNWYKEDNEVKEGKKSQGLKYNAAGLKAGANVALNKGIDHQSGPTLALGHKK